MADDRYYPGLDGLRAVAAMCVVVMHRGVWLGLGPWLAHGYLAVDFFFMLSGFVVAAAYEGRLRDGLSRLAFCRLRLIRLYPLLLLGMAIGAAWAIAATRLGLDAAPVGPTLQLLVRGVLLAPTLAPNAIGVGIFPLDPPAWSLFFELAVNLVYALALPWLGRRGLVAATLLSFLALALLAYGHSGIDQGGAADAYWGGFARVVFPFLGGVLLHRLRDVRWIPAPRLSFPIQAGLLFAVFNIPWLTGAAGGVVDVVCVGLVFPAIIRISTRTRASAREKARLRWLGELSYPLYVLHYPLYVAMGGLAFGFGLVGPRATYAFGIASILVIVAVSQAALSLYDRPVRAWLSKLSSPQTEVRMTLYLRGLFRRS